MVDQLRIYADELRPPYQRAVANYSREMALRKGTLNRGERPTAIPDGQILRAMAVIGALGHFNVTVLRGVLPKYVESFDKGGSDFYLGIIGVLQQLNFSYFDGIVSGGEVRENGTEDYVCESALVLVAEHMQRSHRRLFRGINRAAATCFKVDKSTPQNSVEVRTRLRDFYLERANR